MQWIGRDAVPKVCGIDAELGNFILGLDAFDGRGTG